jgi:hypothetical protein
MQQRKGQVAAHQVRCSSQFTRRKFASVSYCSLHGLYEAAEKHGVESTYISNRGEAGPASQLMGAVVEGRQI